MAEENKAEEVKPEPAKKGPLPPIVVKIAIIAGILVVVGVGSLFLVTEVIAPKLKSSDTAAVEGGQADGEHDEDHEDDHEDDHENDHDDKKKNDKKKDDGHGGGHGEEGGGGPANIVDLGDLVINPAGTAGRRYLKVQVQVELDDPDDSGDVTHRKAKLRDRMIRELTSRTLSELTDPVAKDEMKETIIDEMNRILGGRVIDDLYFTEYVIQ